MGTECFQRIVGVGYFRLETRTARTHSRGRLHGHSAHLLPLKCNRISWSNDLGPLVLLAAIGSTSRTTTLPVYFAMIPDAHIDAIREIRQVPQAVRALVMEEPP